MVTVHRGWVCSPPKPRVDAEDVTFARNWRALTESERDVWRCRVQGKGIDRCAAELGLSPSTVKKNRMRAIFTKMGVEGERESRDLRLAYLLGRFDAAHE